MEHVLRLGKWWDVKLPHEKFLEFCYVICRKYQGMDNHGDASTHSPDEKDWCNDCGNRRW